MGSGGPRARSPRRARSRRDLSRHRTNSVPIRAQRAAPGARDLMFARCAPARPRPCFSSPPSPARCWPPCWRCRRFPPPLGPSAGRRLFPARWRARSPTRAARRSPPARIAASTSDAPPGTVVHAACSGRVVHAGVVAGRERVVSTNCGARRVTYLPLASVAVRAGATVRAGAHDRHGRCGSWWSPRRRAPRSRPLRLRGPDEALRAPRRPFAPAPRPTVPRCPGPRGRPAAATRPPRASRRGRACRAAARLSRR